MTEASSTTIWASPTGTHPGRSAAPRFWLAPAAALALAGCSLFAIAPPSYPPFTTISGVVVQDLVVPTNSQLPFVRGGERLTIHYEIRLPSGEVLDSSQDRAEPLQFVLGAGEVPAGLDEGLIGMRELGRRRLSLSGELAFGEGGPPDDVQDSGTYLFEVELLQVEGGRVPFRVDPESDPRWWGE